MKTYEFSKVVQEQLTKGDVGIGHALELMLILLSGRDCELCREVLHLEQKFRTYQKAGNQSDARDNSHIVFSLLGCLKKIGSMEPIAPEISMRIYTYLQEISSGQEGKGNIHDTKSKPSRSIGLLGVLGAVSLFLIGALWRQPVASGFDVWLEEGKDSTSIYNIINENVNLSEGLIAYYPFDFHSEDIGPEKHPMTNYGAELGLDRFGKYDQAYHFDGKTSWMDLGTFGPENSLSISMWVKMDQREAGQCLIACHDLKRTMPGFAMVYSDSYLYTYLGNSNTHQELLSVDYHHLVLTITPQDESSSRVKLYDNAELLWESTYFSMLSTKQKGRWTIGQMWNKGKSQQFLSGAIDEVRIYNRPLNGAEVDALYTYERKAISIAEE